MKQQLLEKVSTRVSVSSTQTGDSMLKLKLVRTDDDLDD